MARSLSLAVILCVFALRMRTTSQQICLSMNSMVPMVDTSSPDTANQIVASCTSVGPSDDIDNPVWYLNGVNMNESRCLRGSTRSPDAHQLTFTITPDCEGYLQCGIPPMQATCAVSRPRPVYSYPKRTPGTSTHPRTMGAVLGTDVVIPCDFVVSSLGNTKACWTFRSELGDDRELNCTTGPTYNLPISSVTSANAGNYFCKVTADTSNLPNSARAREVGPLITLKVVEPARAEGIKVSVNGDRYMFSVLSPSGSGLRYTWFQNDIVTSSTTGSLTVPDLPRGTTRVKVSISNQIDSSVMFMDSSSTMFTDNVTIEVTHQPRISCQCASPTSLVLPSPSVPEPSTDAGTIVIIVVLALLIVLTFIVIIVLVVVICYRATELKNVRRERDQLQQERDQLQQERDQLQQERDQLQREMDQLQRERDQLQQERDQLQQERDQLQREMDQLQRERDQLQQERDQLRQDKDQLRQDKDQLRQERDQLQQERDQLRRDTERFSDTRELLRKTLEEKSELNRRVTSLGNEKSTLEQENTRLKTLYEANEATLRTKDETLFKLQRQNSELGEQVAVLKAEKGILERQISQSSNFSDETDSKMASSCTKVAKQLTRIVKEIVEDCPESLTPIFCLKTVRTIVDCLTENVNCNNNQFKEVMRNIRHNARVLYDEFVDENKQEQEQSKNLPKRSTKFDGDDEGDMLAVAMDEYQRSLGKLDDKLRELGVEVKDWVRDDQVQKAADLDQEGDDS